MGGVTDDKQAADAFRSVENDILSVCDYAAILLRLVELGVETWEKDEANGVLRTLHSLEDHARTIRDAFRDAYPRQAEVSA